jgi:hypothetical protein
VKGGLVELRCVKGGLVEVRCVKGGLVEVRCVKGKATNSFLNHHFYNNMCTYIRTYVHYCTIAIQSCRTKTLKIVGRFRTLLL